MTLPEFKEKYKTGQDLLDDITSLSLKEVLVRLYSIIDLVKTMEAEIESLKVANQIAMYNIN